MWENKLSPFSLLSMTRDPAFWQKTWDEVVHSSLSAKRRENVPMLDFWNRYAARLARQAQEKHTVMRVKKVLEWLSAQGVEIRGQDILDIGAGTGAFTLPFLEQGARVTALEPARSVREKLAAEVEKRSLKNITYLETPWEEIDPHAGGLADSFDLVFASLVPGIRNTETLEHMIAASRKWCFLCAFAGQRTTTGRDALWHMLMGETMPQPEHEVIVPLNYLYASGYTPSFEVWNEAWVEENSFDEAVADLCDYYHNFLKVTAKIEGRIASFVEQQLVNGVYREHYKVRLGMILWSVDSCWDSRRP